MPLNRGAGMRMKVPCVFRLCGSKSYDKKNLQLVVQDIVKTEIDMVLVT